MATITIEDLEVFYRVGVPDEERAVPQRLLLRIEVEVDTMSAEQSDRIADTIDYFQLTRDLLAFGEGRSWRLIEKLAADAADHILSKYRPASVLVEVKKFVIPETKFVSVRLRKGRD